MIGRITSITCGCSGYMRIVSIEDEIEYMEKRLIPMIKKYGERRKIGVSLIEIKQRLKQFKIEKAMKELYIGDSSLI